MENDLYIQDIVYIQALGHLLSTYSSDLKYIEIYHRFKNSESYPVDALTNFKNFITEFKVVRNVKKGATDQLLQYLFNWLKNNTDKNNHVNCFAEYLKENGKGITHGKLQVSLASKILFLNNPWEVLPIDRRVRKTLNIKENKYESFMKSLGEFRQNNSTTISYYLDSIAQHISIIEQEFEGKIKSIEVIRNNRYLDKVLWTQAGHQSQ